MVLKTVLVEFVLVGDPRISYSNFEDCFHGENCK